MEHSNQISPTESIYKSIYRPLKQQEGVKILMSHFGVFSYDLINSLADFTEELMISNNERKSMIKRVFSIFIESLQNISKHGRLDEDELQKGLLIFYKKDDKYFLVLGNIVENTVIEKLISRLSELNTLSQEEVVERYKSVLSRSILSNSGGGGLGLITIKMKAQSHLMYNFDKISEDNSMFTLSFEINKNLSV